MQLTRKLKEVEYNIKCNENKYNEYLHLRKMATFHLYQKISPNLNESLFNLNSKEIVSSMNLKTWSPWIKLCNKKVVVAFNLLNNNNVCPTQIVSLIHYINDVVPFRIIVTTPNYKITSDTTELTNYNEEIVENEQSINYMQLASSALNQTSMLLEYLDLCMIQMNMSKDYTILNKVGSEIDLFACGLDKFIEFRNRLLKEVYTGIQKCGNNNELLLLRQNSVEIIDDEM
ncbi:hypothetical protein RR46_02231 [Papilio xuthus]|uniref:Uncharacterized protein n=1 Tax=Papilio xuthus TaxID=66420 RepID=A0A194QK05_PAPXU|nr:hypothetical protein RR46_02231 [Papilio xuthus]